MTANINDQCVLVTGGSGFIAIHCILQLLNKGYRVRATVRSLNREAEIHAMLKEGGLLPGGSAGPGNSPGLVGTTNANRLTLIEADLSADTGWDEAVAGCTYVIHVASPTPLKNYKHEDEMIIPAREGVLRVLRASRDAGVQRVVLTSAFGAIGFGREPGTTPFNETDWTEINNTVPVYQRSKTLAERAAWDFIAKKAGSRKGAPLELAVVNPVAVLGPVLGPDYSHSLQLVLNMLYGTLPGCPKINTGIVDVRDVADLHLRVMTNPAANGERFLAVSGESLWMVDIARILKRRLGEKARRVKARQIPNWLIRLSAIKNPVAKVLVPLLGRNMNASGEKAKRILGWSPRSAEEAIVASAESLQRLGLLKS